MNQVKSEPTSTNHSDVNKSHPSSSGQSGSGVPAQPAAPLADVWRQAFGAVKPPPPKKPPQKQSPPVKQEGGQNALAALKLNYLAIPPEAKRKARPTYGGIIHFSPDWVQVRGHYDFHFILMTFPGQKVLQLSYLKRMTKSVSIGFDTAMKMGS